MIEDDNILHLQQKIEINEENIKGEPLQMYENQLETSQHLLNGDRLKHEQDYGDSGIYFHLKSTSYEILGFKWPSILAISFYFLLRILNSEIMIFE